MKYLATGCASVGAMLVSAALLADGGIASGPGAPNAKVMQDWETRLRAIDQMLIDGEHREAYEDADALLHEMCSRIVRGKGAFPLMALASTFRAVAESGRGNDVAALWDFHTARAFVPDLEDVDLSKYGEAGTRLEALASKKRDTEPMTLPPPPAKKGKKGKKARKARAAETEEGDSEKNRLRAPVRIVKKPPEYPAGLLGACIEGVVLISSVIGTDGVPNSPQVLRSDGGPVMSYAALEAARQWRFRPARAGNTPISVYFMLSVTFSSPTCNR